MKKNFQEKLEEIIGKNYEIIELNKRKYINILESYQFIFYDEIFYIDKNGGCKCLTPEVFLNYIKDKTIFKLILNFNDENEIISFITNNLNQEFKFKNGIYQSEEFNIKIDNNGFILCLDDNLKLINKCSMDDIYNRYVRGENFNEYKKNDEYCFNEFKKFGIEIDNEMTINDKKELNIILSDKNHEISKFIKNDLQNIIDNCEIRFIKFCKDDLNIFKLYLGINSLGNIKANYQYEALIFKFNTNGKIIKKYTFSENGCWNIFIDDFKNQGINFSFLTWLGERCNLAYDIGYEEYNNKEENYRNKNYEDFYISVEMDTENGCKSKYKDIQKLYDEFVSGNFDLSKVQ